MIEYAQGNLLESEVEAQVNTVNTVGIMGAGIALQFKQKYPDCFYHYQIVCKQGHLNIGSMFVYPTPAGSIPKYIINFPTKKHWKNPSEIEWIEEGLDCLKYTIQLYNIKSIAIPALGCQNGGLSWTEIKPLIEKHMKELSDVKVIIYEPQKFIK